MPSVWKKAALGRAARFRPDRFTLFLAALAVLGAVLVLLHEVTYGAMLEWDSVTYIAVARNLLAGNGLVQPYDGNYYVLWPPLFPGLLALASLFVFDPHKVAGLVNAAAFGLTIFLAGRWLRSRIESRVIVLWGCLAIALSASLIQNAVWVISEPVFILFTLLALVETEKFLNTDRRSSLVRSALFTALACLTRYIGISIVLTVVLLLLFKSKRTKPFLEKVRYVAAYSLISVTPLGIWLLRNMLLSGTLTGYERSHPPAASFPEYLQQTLDVLAGWAFPLLNPIPAGATAAVGIALLALAVAAGYGLLRSRWEAETRPGENTIAIFGTFALIYLAFLLAAASSTPVGVTARHFCPAYIPLLFIVAFALDKLLRSDRQATLSRTVVDRPRVFVRGYRRVSLLTAVMASALVLWLAGSAVVIGRGIQAANGDGSEYFPGSLSSARFTDSAVLQYMREHPVTGWVYSNEHFGVYIHTDGLAKYTVLHKTEQRLVQAVRECASATAGFQCDPPLHREHRLIQAVGEQAAADYDVHIVWFYDLRWHLYDYDSFALWALPGVETVAELADGVVLRVTPGHFDMDRYLANKEALLTALIKEAGEPIIRSTFDVYVNDHKLIYVTDACSQDDRDALFSLHWAPTDKAHLPAYWKEYGFNVRDFRLEEYGVKSGGRCVAVVPLPAYDISQIKTGQFVYGPEKELVWRWRDSFQLDE